MVIRPPDVRCIGAGHKLGPVRSLDLVRHKLPPLAGQVARCRTTTVGDKTWEKSQTKP
jgi:hypothetical protein